MDRVVAYVAASWVNLYLAIAGATAALLGLLFVAVSINLEQVLRRPHLPLRAAETMAVLLALLATAVFVLVPGQGRADPLACRRTPLSSPW